MLRIKITTVFMILLIASLTMTCSNKNSPEDVSSPIVRMSTSLGVIELELDRGKAPVTVENFLQYVKSDFYSGTIFHRVIPGFMIQGGGFEPGMKQKSARGPIKNEADNGLKNLPGTIAMARTSDPHSAAAQFFINTVENSSLDHRNKTQGGWGYTVFGRVTKGMEVVKKIEASPTTTIGPFQNVPRKEVSIKGMEIVTQAD